MFVVAYLYNRNGMASWCWEAAHALHEANYPVLLVCSPEVVLPDEPQVEILRYIPPAPPEKANRVSSLLGRLSADSSGFAYHLHEHLHQQGIKPSAYLLNQSDLQDPRVDVPQYVVAWAAPSSLQGYLAKIGKATGWKMSIASLRTCADSFGWWRKDWRAYRSATAVLAVSKLLKQELIAQKVRTHVVYPGTQFPPYARRDEVGSPPCRLLIVALDLDEPRKRVRFMINALSKLEIKEKFTLTLVGHASEDFRNWVGGTALDADFKGQLDRAAVQEEMGKHDVFLFGSNLDDWGYVLIEAMAQGMCIAAPNLSPFNEMIDKAVGELYSPYSPSDFQEKVRQIVESDYAARSREARQTAENRFSRSQFASQILAATDSEITSHE